MSVSQLVSQSSQSINQSFRQAGKEVRKGRRDRRGRQTRRQGDVPNERNCFKEREGRI